MPPIVIPVVVGSNPIAHPNFPPDNTWKHNNLADKADDQLAPITALC